MIQKRDGSESLAPTENKNGVVEKPESLGSLEKYESYWKDLQKQDPVEYRKKWGPDIRKGYVEEGATFLVDVHEKGVNTIILLDRGARPLTPFFMALWERMYPKEKPPEMRCITGRPKLLGKIEAAVIKNENVARISQLRQTFAGSNDIFNHKIVLVIDDMVMEGHTIRQAKAELLEAFPQIKTALSGAIHFGEDPLKFIDIKPAAGSQTNPSYFTNHTHTLGHLTDSSPREVKKIRNRVFSEQLDNVPPTKSTSYRLFNVAQFENLGQQSLAAVQKASAYCAERNDRAGLNRLAKIKMAFLNLQAKNQ